MIRKICKKLHNNELCITFLKPSVFKRNLQGEITVAVNFSKQSFFQAQRRIEVIVSKPLSSKCS